MYMRFPGGLRGTRSRLNEGSRTPLEARRSCTWRIETPSSGGWPQLWANSSRASSLELSLLISASSASDALNGAVVQGRP
eukprot:56508-Eustigmatos_ZCMA.PRE.1